MLGAGVPDIDSMLPGEMYVPETPDQLDGLGRSVVGPERTRSLLNRNLDVGHVDFAAQALLDFLGGGRLEEKAQGFFEVRPRFGHGISLAGDIDLRAQSHIPVPVAFHYRGQLSPHPCFPIPVRGLGSWLPSRARATCPGLGLAGLGHARVRATSCIWFECEDVEGETLPIVQQLTGGRQALTMSTMMYIMSCIVYIPP